MARTTMINFRMDTEAKKEVEEMCANMGLTMTAAINVFLSKLRKERRIPFEITADADPFYSESNMKYLERIASDIRSGKAKLVEHELIEED